MFIENDYSLNDLQLENYLNIHINKVNQFQYDTPQNIIDICQYLNLELKQFAIRNSIVYKNHCGIISKEQLLNKEKWYTKKYQADNATTGGSTTGSPFQYLRWATHFPKIERDLHYKLILQEFGLDNKINVLYLMLDQIDDKTTTKFVRNYTTDNILISHGKHKEAHIHDVIKNKLYYNNYYEFYERLFNYAHNNSIDVILCPGQIVKAMAWNARRLKWIKPLCKLLSNTGEKVDLNDLNYLKNNGLIDNWCDHMRCWDGGITFFTCAYHTYHLLDGLSWVTSDNNKLISTDYYSLPSPFVNYWNGDYGTVEKNYQKCDCGRYYRHFDISRVRSTQLSGVASYDIKNKITESEIEITNIKRVEATHNFIRIFTIKPYSSNDRMKVRKLLPKFEINFITEEPNE